MRKIILAVAAFLTGFLAVAQNTTKDTKNVQYHFFTNNIPSDWNCPLVGFVNNVDGNHASVQVGIVNSTTGGFGGLQLGIINSVGTNVTGIQSGFLNAVGGEVSGVSNGFINAIGADVKGIQNGFINSVGKSVYGIQSGFVNSVGQQVTGLQYGFINSANAITGLQCGFINSTKTLRGLQLGFINSVDNVEKGLPIGFLSFVKNGGYKAIEVSYNSISPINVAFKTGIREFYTYPMLAYDSRLRRDRLSFGYGIGSNIDFTQGFFINPELDWLHQVSMDFNHLTTLKCNLGFNLGNRLEILAGPSLFWQFKIDADLYHHNYTEWDPTIISVNDVTIGWNAALRYRF